MAFISQYPKCYTSLTLKKKNFFKDLLVLERERKSEWGSQKERENP